jgi:Tol biopolymer transport system component
MNPAPSGPASQTDTSPRGDRLDSWKEIAAYLKRSVRTLHRWEKEEGLPVHRQLHKELGSVFAYKSELDAWARARSPRTASPDGQAETTAARRYLRVVSLWLGVSTLIVGAVLSMFTAIRSFQVREAADELIPPPKVLELLSTFPGSHRSPSISPDSRVVAFIGDVDGTPQLWVKNLAGGNPTQLTFADVPAMRPRWAAAGDRIIYSLRGHGVWSIAAGGGVPRQIIENGWNADPSPDGRRLVFERPGEILIANADGTEAIPLPAFPGRTIPHYGDTWPTFSPDGGSIAIFLAEHGQYGDYWAIPSAGGEPRRLTSDMQRGGAPAWAPDGKAVIAASSRGGSVNLWRLPVDPGEPEALTTGVGEDIEPAVSRDGRMLFFANVKRTWTVTVHDLRTGQRKMLLEKRTALLFPRYSRDGRRIALMGRSARGDMQMFVMDADGSNLRPVTDGLGELNSMPTWAADDKTLYFYQERPTETFRQIDAAGGTSREIAPWLWRRENSAEADPRGRTILYSLVERGSLRQSRVRELETGRETALPFALFNQRFSRDGRLVAGESRDHELVTCDLAGQCRRLTRKAERGLSGITWSGDGRRLFFVRLTSAPQWGELRSVDVDGETEQGHGPVGPFRESFHISMDVSPRDEMVFASCREEPHELWTVKLR